MVAHLIKNPPINHAKRIIVNEEVEFSLDNEQIDASAGSNRDDTSGFEVQRTQAGPADENSSNNNDEIKLVDGKVIYQGKVYFSEESLERRVQEEMDARKEELDAVREEHIQAGIDQGYKEGLRRANDEYQEKISNVMGLFEKIKDTYEVHVGQGEDLIKETIFIAICKSFRDLLENKNERIGVIENVIANLKNTNPIKIKVSQTDYKLIFNSEDSDLANNFNVEVDNRVEIGGCIVETDKGILDGRLEVQLAKLKEAVML